MFTTNARAAALAGVVLATLGLPAKARSDGDCCSPCPPPCAPAAPAMRTITVTEWVPETYKTTVTAYKTECITENYTAYRTETVPEKYTAYRTECVSETRTRQYTISRMVPVTSKVMVTVYKCVPTVEKRVVNRTVVSYQPVTTTVRKCVDQGHYECREVPVHTLHSRLRRCFHRGDDCCEPCVPTRTVKVWVPNKVWIEVPVTINQRVCSTVSETIDVTVNRMVPTQEERTVTTCQCVPEVKTETYCVLVPKQVAFEATRMVCRTVPYQATRQVAKCVPYQTEVTATRMVCRTVERQVPAAECCGITVSSHGFGGHRLFGRGGHGHRGGCCH
jgi:hypothetical protein